MKNKFNEVVGIFWGASLFIGVLVTLIIGFNGNYSSDWIKAVLIGICAFLIVGLIAQGIVTLMRKDK